MVLDVRFWRKVRKGKAVRSPQLTANRRQPMQMKRHARLKEGGSVLPRGAAMVVAASLRAFITGTDER
jgi:hypothetical protein